MATTRAKTSERGYGAAHRRERKRWEARLNAGLLVECARRGHANGPCTHPEDLITKDTPWDLGHTDDRTGWTGPEHVDCNRRAGQRNAMRARPAAWSPGVTSRDWLNP